MARLIWYLKRVSVMGPREVLHRIGEHLQIAAMRRSHRRGAASVHVVHPSRSEFCSAITPQLPELAWANGPDAEVRAALLSGQGAALGFKWNWSDDPDVWRRAPDTGRLWPAEFFGDIPFRANNPYGDVRVVWEPARLQHLVSLALLARQASIGGEASNAVTMIESQLISWVALNPPWKGVHYISSMECGLRLIAVCHAVDLVRHRLHAREAVWMDLLSLVASHAPLILRRLSRYSSAGNHTIAEAAALVYAGILFPELVGANKWRRRGLDLLRREVVRQILPDGGGIERAFSYHRIVLDLLGLVEALLTHRGEAVPGEIAAAITRGRRFLQSVEVRPNLVPPVGDGDGGYALSPFLVWPRRGKAVTAPVAVFPNTGYTMLRTGAHRLTVLFDHGPLGMAPVFGHGHADALSVVAYFDGAPLLVDPGTFAYTVDAEWRRYFRSTRAHNTIEVERRDQARQETLFQWSRPYSCELVRSESEANSEAKVRLLARHDGYSTLGVTHWRGIIYQMGGPLFVWDRLEGSGARRLALHWHCGVPPEATTDGFRLEVADQPVFLAIHGGVTTPHRGEIDPLLGWFSPDYGVRMPLTTLRTDYCGSLPHELITLLGTSEEDLTPDAVSGDIRILRSWTRASGAG